MKYRARLFDQDCFQLIPSRFPPIDVYERLGLPELRTAAQELEQRTNPRLIALRHIEKPPDPSHKDAPQYQNWNHAPFVYKNPEGSHFLGPALGVAEMSTDLDAALMLALFRREEFFSRTNEEGMGQDMRVLSRRVTGTLIDLTASTLGWRKRNAGRSDMRFSRMVQRALSTAAQTSVNTALSPSSTGQFLGAHCRASTTVSNGMAGS